MRNITRNDYKRMAKTESLWATLARNEGKDNLRQAHRARTMHHPILARHYTQEARWDNFWANRRHDLAETYRRKSKGRR
jgi:hypothetical protein